MNHIEPLPVILFAVVLGLALVVLFAALCSRPWRQPQARVATAYIVVNWGLLELRILMDDGGFYRFPITTDTLSRLSSESAQALHRIRARRDR